MIDIIFIVLLFLIFLIGYSNYENFESSMTEEDELHQSNKLKSLTDNLDENITGTIGDITSMVGDVSSDVPGKVDRTKKWIERCVGSVRHCGQEPYGSTCSRRSCGRVPCGTSCSGSGWRRRCSTRYCTRCHTINYGCLKWRRKCTPTYPVWKCSPSPSGYKSPPGFPSGWRR